MSVALGIGLAGAAFYGVVSSHYIGAVIGRTLGPYTDSLVEHGFESSDPEIWRKMAAHHGVAILIEPAGVEPEAWDERGEPAQPSAIERGRILAVRTGPGGTRVTFSWTLATFSDTHLPLLGGLVVMVILVVGSAFWFLQRQLKPLGALGEGVEAVASGDFGARVPVVRRDEIGEVAEAFNSMAGRVGQMVDDRERLLADVSHELRSPIARMKVALEFLPEGDKRDALADDLREMERLIGVLLDRQRLLESGGRLREEVALCGLVREVIDGMDGAEPGVDFDSSGEVAIEADPVLIRLLVQNLLDNAIKFSRADSLPVRVSVESRDDRARLRVVDDGVGIPPGSEERLFEPFTKADAARGHGAGYGLGLNLCRRIVELHDGTIRLLRSEPRGCAAVVTLGVSTRS